MKTKNRFSSALTFLELLVLVAFIAILVGVMTPFFNMILERGHATMCASNLRQLGIGTSLYLVDNDERYFSSSDMITWPEKLQSKYVRNWKAYVSEFDKRVQKHPDFALVSYGINENILNDRPLLKTVYTNKSSLVYMAPAMDKAHDIIFSGNSSMNVIIKEPSKGSPSMQGTHRGRTRINVLFADGHVSELKYVDFKYNFDLVEWVPSTDPERLPYR